MRNLNNKPSFLMQIKMKNKFLSMIIISAAFAVGSACAETFKRPPPIPVDNAELNGFISEATECLGVNAAVVTVVADSKNLTKESFEAGRGANEMVPVLNGFLYYSLIVGGNGRKLGETYTDIYAAEVSKSMQARANEWRKKYADGFVGYFSKRNDGLSTKAAEKYISCSKILNGNLVNSIYNHTKKYEIYSPR